MAYFGGFFSGEGCFLLTERNARIAVKLRRDDRPLLETFKDSFGFGRIYDVPASPLSAPSALWTVVNSRELLDVVDVLEAAGLHGRKFRQFRAWRHAALEIGRAAAEYRPRDKRKIAGAAEAFRRVSEYRPQALRDSCEPHAETAVRNACVSVLREWAATTSAPRLSTNAYIAERKSGWPNRNTIARWFGSWKAALEAAGLS